MSRTHPLFAWTIMRDLPEYPRAVGARPVIDTPTSYTLVGQTLAEVQVQLPPG
jgi:hypothetical protein